ncbi:MAG: VWA domain-containing protein, partial [Clostridium sp.]|nr:VWA domain-containing protein [Clostridium sp.]
MKELKRISAFFMAMLMMLTVFSAFSVVSAEGEAADGTQPVWPAQGSIKLDKDAAAVEGTENLWEVTLGIQGKNFETTSDVVLVIDNSNSMYENDRMVQTKAAANAFVDALLTQDSATRIAVVVFNDKVEQTGFYDYSNKEALKAYINAVSMNEADGGTFTQLGIKTARDLLKSSASTGLNKNIVLLSDGLPTWSYLATGTATGTCTTWLFGTITHNDGCDENTVKINGCNYNMQEGNGTSADDGSIELLLTCKHGKTKTETYTISHSYATIWEAQQAANDGMTVFSIALQAGTTGENVLRACATNPATGFYAIASTDNIEEKLTTAFTSIAGSIAIAASNGVVNDPMGEHVQLSFSG